MGSTRDIRQSGEVVGSAAKCRMSEVDPIALPRRDAGVQGFFGVLETGVWDLGPPGQARLDGVSPHP